MNHRNEVKSISRQYKETLFMQLPISSAKNTKPTWPSNPTFNVVKIIITTDRNTKIIMKYSKSAFKDTLWQFSGNPYERLAEATKSI